MELHHRKLGDILCTGQITSLYHNAYHHTQPVSSLDVKFSLIPMFLQSWVSNAFISNAFNPSRRGMPNTDTPHSSYSSVFKSLHIGYHSNHQNVSGDRKIAHVIISLLLSTISPEPLRFPAQQLAPQLGRLPLDNQTNQREIPFKEELNEKVIYKRRNCPLLPLIAGTYLFNFVSVSTPP